MDKIINFAQKALVLNNEDKLLLIRYSSDKFKQKNHVISNRYGLPGGRIKFGESVDTSIIREVLEETGITCQPNVSINCYNWIIDKPNQKIQINAVTRLCQYISGNIINQQRDEGETTISQVLWVPINNIVLDNCIDDEVPSIKLLQDNLQFYKQFIMNRFNV